MLIKRWNSHLFLIHLKCEINLPLVVIALKQIGHLYASLNCVVKRRDQRDLDSSSSK
jgi:hypothetical protein